MYDREVGRVVIDDKNACVGRQRWQRGRRGFIGRVVQRQFNPKGRTVARCARHADGAAHQLRQMFGNCQAESSASVFARGGNIRLTEWREQFCQREGINADAGVGNRKPVPGAACGRFTHERRYFDNDLSARGEFNRVAEQIAEQLPQAYRVAHRQQGNASVNIADDFQAFLLRAVREQPGGVFDDLPQIEIHALDIELAGFDFGEIEDVVEYAQQGLSRAVNSVCVTSLLLLQRRVQQHLGHSQHAVHRRANFVAHIGEECGLRPAGDLRFLGQHLGFRSGCLQCARALFHTGLEFALVIEQLCAGVFEAFAHMIERGDQAVDITFGVEMGAAFEIAVGDGARGRYGALQRVGQAPDHTRDEKQRKQAGRQRGNGDDVELSPRRRDGFAHDGVFIRHRLFRQRVDRQAGFIDAAAVGGKFRYRRVCGDGGLQLL